MKKKLNRVQRRPKYETEFDIDISKLEHGKTIIVKDTLDNKYTVVVVDPKKHLVRVTKKGIKKEKGWIKEGSFTGLKGIKEKLRPYCLLPVPKGHPSTFVEKVRL